MPPCNRSPNTVSASSTLDKMVASRADTTEHPPLSPVVDAFAYLPLER